MGLLGAVRVVRVVWAIPFVRRKHVDAKVLAHALLDFVADQQSRERKLREHLETSD